MSIYVKKNLLALLCLGLICVVSCKKDKPKEEEEIQKKGIQLATDAKFGTILTDSAGRTLYMFSTDVAGTPSCTGGCETNWPLYYSSNASTDLGLNAAEVSVVTRVDGRKQSTYKGYPLYYYKDDAAPGETKGDGVAGIWFVGKPDYSLMLANAQLVGANGIQYTSTYVEGVGNTRYFTDSKGRTLYAFAPDKNMTNTFTKPDLSNNAVWPVFEETLKSLPSVMAKADFGSITVFGKTQMTYKGWPLYYFSQDNARGINKGVSIGPAPGHWPVLTLTSAVAPAP
jgi:predicted lipoprotein with Yx(FWY)xxD motif